MHKFSLIATLFLVGNVCQTSHSAPQPNASATKIAALTEDAFGAIWMDSDLEESEVEIEVRKALDAGASPNARSRFSGETLLLQAIENNRLSTARLLIARGADVNLADAKSGDTPLIRASSTSDWTAYDQRSLTEFVALLLQKRADPNRRNNAGETAMTLAVIEGRGNVVLQLLKGSADFRMANKNGQTPLQLASIVVMPGSMMILAPVEAPAVKDPNDPKQVKEAIAEQEAMLARMARTDEKRLAQGRANAKRYLIAAGAKK